MSGSTIVLLMYFDDLRFLNLSNVIRLGSSMVKLLFYAQYIPSLANESSNVINFKRIDPVIDKIK